MNWFLFNLINKIFFIPLAVQKRLLAWLEKFYKWHDALPLKYQRYFKIIVYWYIIAFGILLKVNYELYFTEVVTDDIKAGGLKPIEMHMGVWASHFISIDTTQYLKNIPLILEFLIKRFFLVIPILIFFKDIYKKNFFILFYFLYNFYNLNFSSNLFFSWNFLDLFSDLKINTLSTQKLLNVCDSKFEYLKDNLSIYGSNFYGSFFVLQTLENLLISGWIKMFDFVLEHNYFPYSKVLLEEIFIMNMLSFFLQKKIIFFFFLNFIIIIGMFYNLTKLYKSINLIYALLHFLFFAILSGLLILLWGNSYLAFCVLLIYGAAIPVLALYIIMLVNVDLIQRLFFYEHLTSNIVIEKKKRLFLFLFLFLYFIFSFRNINFDLKIIEYPWLNEIYKNIFFLTLSEKYFDSIQFSYGYTTIYDLVLSFYSSDIDKVASSAFKVSYNELFALVLLLLIAIIVVISISRPTSNLIKFPHETILPNFKKFQKGFDYSTKKIFLKINRLLVVEDFLINRSYHNELHGNRLNSVHDPIYLHHQYYTNFGFHNFGRWNTDIYGRLAVDPEPENPEDPWSEWFKVYNKTLFRDDLEWSPQVWKFLGKPTSMTGWESFTNEEILIYNATHWIYL